MKFIPRGEFVLLEVEAVTETPSGIKLPQQSHKINLSDPLKVIAVGKEVDEFEVGDYVLLDMFPNGTVEEMLLNIPESDSDYIIVPQGFIAGKLEGYETKTS